MILPSMILLAMMPFAVPSTVVDPVAHVWQSAGGQTARSTAGEVGQRRTREEVARDAGFVSTGRIGNRIQSRVRTRVRSRIDQFYTPQADAASPFAEADEHARTPGRR